MIQRIFGYWLIRIFCIVLAAFLFLDYVHYSDYYITAFGLFEYTGLLITLLVVTALIAYLLSDRKKSKWHNVVFSRFRGAYHYLFVLLVMALVMFSYLSKIDLTDNAGGSTIIFVFRSILFHLGLFLILLSAWSTGSFLLGRFQISLEQASFILVSMAIGLFVICLCLFVLGSFGLLNQYIVFSLIFALVIPRWKSTLSSLRRILFTPQKEFSLPWPALIAYTFIILLISVALIFNTRTFPLGFDALGLYMNTSKLIANYQALTDGGDAYNWSIIMSLGFIMYNNTTIAILLSVVPGILSLFAIYRICINLKVSNGWSLAACAMYFSLPNTIWQSRFDEKTDFAMLFVSLCAVLLFLSRESSNKSNEKAGVTSGLHAWIVCGILMGFAFGIKYISMLCIFAFLVWLFYREAGKYGAIAMFFLNLVVIFFLDLTRFAAFEKETGFVRVAAPLALALIALFLAMKNRLAGIMQATKKAAIFCSVIAITFLPWAIKHIQETQSFSVSGILSGKMPLPELYSQQVSGTSDGGTSQLAVGRNDFSHANYAGISSFDFLGKGTKLIAQAAASNAAESKSNDQTVNEEKQEEIRRYLGYESGIIRFLSLPYDIVMKTNVRMTASDCGILLLVLVITLMFVFSLKKLHWNVVKFIMLIVLLAVSILSVQQVKGAFSIDAAIESIRSGIYYKDFMITGMLAPIYLALKGAMLHICEWILPFYKQLTLQDQNVSFMLLTLLSIPLYFVFRSAHNGQSLESKSLMLFVFSVLYYWLILSSGIVWYGIVGFSLVPVIVVLWLSVTPSEDKKFLSRYFGVCLSIWMVLILPFQFMPPQFLYVPDKSKMNFNEFTDRQFVKYAIGEQNEQAVFKKFYSQVQHSILRTLNSDKESRILSVSTFLNYFIVNNDKRVYRDNQLGIFREIYANAGNDPSKLAGEFKKAKIRYIYVSLNTAKIDRTPDRSLTKKFDDLMMALVNNPEVRLLHTNRIVERHDGDMEMNVKGSIVKAKYDVIGKSIIDPGSDALFEIF